MSFKTECGHDNFSFHERGSENFFLEAT